MLSTIVDVVGELVGLETLGVPSPNPAAVEEHERPQHVDRLHHALFQRSSPMSLRARSPSWSL